MLKLSKCQYALKRPLRRPDFEVFDKYASRIRVVDFSSFTGLGAGLELFSALKAHRDPLFPRLQEFIWHPSVNFGTEAAFHLISRTGPAVPNERFSLTIWTAIATNAFDESQRRGGYLTSRTERQETIDAINGPLSSWLPDVRCLQIHTGAYLSPERVLDGLKVLTELQDFTWYTSVGLGDTMSLLAGLSSLRSLRLVEKVATSEIRTGTKTSFPVLEAIAIKGTYDALTRLLSIITSDSLHTVTLELIDLHPIEPALFTLITKSPSRPGTMRHFTFGVPDSTIPTASRPAVFSMAAFAPIYECHGLETFDLTVDAERVEFDETDLQQMAKAWPQLQVLRVFSRYTQQTKWQTPGVGLYALWTLVEHCPRLRELSMPVDADVENPFTFPTKARETGNGPIALYNLRKMCLFLSPCGSPDHVGTFINRFFPNLTEFTAGAPSHRKIDSRSWATVKDQLTGVDVFLRKVLQSLKVTDSSIR